MKKDEKMTNTENTEVAQMELIKNYLLSIQDAKERDRDWEQKLKEYLQARNVKENPETDEEISAWMKASEDADIESGYFAARQIRAGLEKRVIEVFKIRLLANGLVFAPKLLLKNKEDIEAVFEAARRRGSIRHEVLQLAVKYLG